MTNRVMSPKQGAGWTEWTSQWFHFPGFIIIIIITRPKPAYGRQGLAGRSLCASGAQLGRGK